MGTKEERESLRTFLLEKALQWSFPPSDWEAAMCLDLAAKASSVVPRAPIEQLVAMRMMPNECHANARWYADNDPDNLSKAVAGWLVEDDAYVLHSVIEQEGVMICITPSAFAEPTISFIPDPRISWRLVGETYCPVIDGRDIGPGIRKRPEFTIAMNEIARKQLLSGVDPYEVGELRGEEFSALKRKYETL